MAAEKNGFDSVWYADHLTMRPGPPTVVFNAQILLTKFATLTQRVLLGTCVSDPHRNHPAVFAEMLATLDQISGGRVILGLGAGESMNLDMFGIKWDRPVSRMGESMTIMRKLWTEERTSFKGRFYELNNAYLQIKPVEGAIPIYIAGNGLRTRRLTGQIGDGWIPLYESPESYKEHLKEVEEGAKLTGRSLEDIDTALMLYTAISEDFEAAYKRVAPYVSFRAGLGIGVRQESAKDRVIELNAIGKLDDVMSRLEKYIKAGLKHFILLNRGPDPHEVFRIYGQKIIPYFKEEFSERK
jgi:alkanesulfonate monooxygenase SsuD/methylene tetrahydromethanopterin reductase-like flavin-dependent oxidoreductase (luciferase family)